jgi:hypothetical protein
MRPLADVNPCRETLRDGNCSPLRRLSLHSPESPENPRKGEQLRVSKECATVQTLTPASLRKSLRRLRYHHRP